MKYPVFAVRDVHVGFNSPMTDISDETAIRNFSFAVNNNNDVMNFAAKDFDLYRLGTFDTDSGYFDSEPVPVLICSGASVIGANVK